MKVRLRHFARNAEPDRSRSKTARSGRGVPSKRAQPPLAGQERPAPPESHSRLGRLRFLQKTASMQARGGKEALPRQTSFTGAIEFARHKMHKGDTHAFATLSQAGRGRPRGAALERDFSQRQDLRLLFGGFA